MTSSNQIITTSIIYHNDIRSTNLLNDTLNMNEIRKIIENLFGDLPNSYSLKVYDPENAEMIDLNQHILDYEYNPFRPSPLINDVRLYVHINRWEEFDNNILSQSTLLSREPHCQQASSLHLIDTASPFIDLTENTPTNQQTDTLESVLLTKGWNVNVDQSSNINYEKCSSDLLASWNNIPLNIESDAGQTPVQTFNDRGQPVQDASSNDISDTWRALQETFASNEQSVQRPDYIAFIDTSLNDVSFNNSNGASSTVLDLLDNQRQSIPNLMGNTLPPKNNRLNRSQNFNGRRATIERNNTQKKELKRLQFTLDVKPRQKPIYKSDQFNKKDKKKMNGRITRIQGIKTGKPENSSVLPIISIPENYQNKLDVFLDVYAVSELKQREGRCWIKHRDKGFLPSPFTQETIPVNPISFALNGTNVKNGFFKLTLPMTTMCNKSESSDIAVHRLGEDAAISLHSAVYEPLTPRLLCVLREGDIPNWDTVCLSDYIRSTTVN